MAGVNGGLSGNQTTLYFMTRVLTEWILQHSHIWMSILIRSVLTRHMCLSVEETSRLNQCRRCIRILVSSMLQRHHKVFRSWLMTAWKNVVVYWNQKDFFLWNVKIIFLVENSSRGRIGQHITPYLWDWKSGTELSILVMADLSLIKLKKVRGETCQPC